MPLTCPVCNVGGWPVGSPRCICGYDFVSGEPAEAIARLADDVRRGNRTWRRGLFLMVLLPVSFVIAELSSVGAALLLAHFAATVTCIVGGLYRADVANRKLAAAKELKRLPAARVLRKPRDP